MRVKTEIMLHAGYNIKTRHLPIYTFSQILMATLHPAPITALSRLWPGAFCAPSSTAVSRCSSSSSRNSSSTLFSSGSEGWSFFSMSGLSARI